MREARLNVHGIGIGLRSHAPAVSAAFEHDFAYFVRTAGDPAPDSGLVVTVEPAGRRPMDWRPFFSGPKSRIFRSPGSERRVCFFDRAWVIYRFAEGTATIYCDEDDAAYETVYLVVLSYIGERLDRRGIHRLHGLGISFGDEGMVLMAPSGTGKSTLGMNLLKGGDTGILSDDTPLLAPPATLMAMPLRIGLIEPPDVDPQHVRKFRRASHGEKFVVSAHYFLDRVRPSVPLRWVVELRRGAGRTSSFRPASRIRWAVLLFKWLVVGHETPQIWELYLRFTPGDVFAKALILFHRISAWARLLRRCEFLAFEMSTDPAEAAGVVRRFREVPS